MMNAMLISFGMPNHMWGEAILTENHVLNRVPHKALDKTPYELWKGYAPTLKYLKVWGCLAKVAYPTFKRETVGSRTFDCAFIGHANNSSAYHFMRLNDKSICEYRDAEFFENIFPLMNNAIPTSVLPLIENTSSSVTLNAPIGVIDEPRKNKRKRTETSFGPDFVTTFLIELRDMDKIDESIVCIHMIEDDPRTYEEAMSSIDSNF